MLKMVRLCMHQHPGLFGEGEGAIVGPFLLVLVPALAEPRLACLNDQIVKTVNDFMDLTVVDRCVVPCSCSCHPDVLCERAWYRAQKHPLPSCAVQFDADPLATCSIDSGFDCLIFLDLVDVLAAVLRSAHAAHENEAPAAQDPQRCLKRIGQLAQQSVEPAGDAGSFIGLHTHYARTEMSRAIVRITAHLVSISPAGLAEEVHLAWGLVCRSPCTLLPSSHLSCCGICSNALRGLR